MAYKQASLPQVGEVFLYKRKGAKNIRLSVTASGKVRVSLPGWMPYSAGLAFAAQRSDWLKQQLKKQQTGLLCDKQIIGKYHRLYFRPGGGKITAFVGPHEVVVKTNLPADNAQVQVQAKDAAERALRQQAAKLLPYRVQQLADRNSYRYKEVKIKKLTARWGSCSSESVITLSYFLIQLPWQLIDYVIIHELAHTKQHNHQRQFWALVEKSMPGFRNLRQEIKQYSPRLLTNQKL